MPKIVCVLAAFLLAACAAERPWAGADDFKRELRCGMTTEQIAMTANKYGAKQHGRPEMAGKDPLSPDYGVVSGTTYFALRYEKGHLSTIGEGHVDKDGYTVVDRVIYLCGNRNVEEPLLRK